MKNIFPDQLVQRTTQHIDDQADIRAGDRVTLVLSDGHEPVVSTVKMAITLNGCTTYTSESYASDAKVAARFRFRRQDIHRLYSGSAQHA